MTSINISSDKKKYNRTESKVNIFIVDSFSTGKKFNDRWIKIGKEIETWGNAKVTFIDGIQTSDKFVHYIYNSSTVTANIDSLVSMHKRIFNFKTIWIFPNALNSTILHLRTLAHNLGIEIVTIGYWSYEQNFISNYGKDTPWMSYYIKSLSQMYDYNLVERDFFINSESIISKIKTRNSNVVESKFPYNISLIDISKIELDFNDKHLMVVQTSNYITTKEKYFIKILRDKLHDYNLIIIDELNISSYEYYKILSKAKLLFCITNDEIPLHSIFEAMLLGVKPLIPSTVYNKRFLNKEYYYDRKSLDNYLDFIRIIPKVIDEFVLFDEKSMGIVKTHGIEKVNEYYDDLLLNEILHSEIDMEYKADLTTSNANRKLLYHQWLEKQNIEVDNIEENA